MRRLSWIIGLVIVVVGGYVIGGGLVWMARVRADEVRLQRAIATVTLPEFQLVQRQTFPDARAIWFGWLVAHMPILDPWDSRPWRPGQPAAVRAVYRTTASAAAVHTQYLARFDPAHDLALASNGYYLAIPTDTVDLTITIEPGPLQGNGDLVPTPTPQVPAPAGSASQGQGSGQNTESPPEARIEMRATFRLRAPDAYPSP